jgi:hypothetical protein
VHPTFPDGGTLKKIVQRPMLGTVSLIRSPEVLSRGRRRALLFAGGVGGLAAAYGAILLAVFFRPLLPF